MKPRARLSRLRPWLIVATASAAVIVPVSAAATWHTSSGTLIEFRDVCRDGIRFGGAVRDGSGPATGPYKNTAVVVQPPPTSWADWTDRAGLMMDTPITIPVKSDTIDTEEGGATTVSHEGSFTMRYQVRPVQLGPVTLNLEGGSPQSNVTTADVTNCFLYAPIDVQPGSRTNRVPIGHGLVTVAALGSKLLPAAQLKAADLRFGPKQAHARSSQLRDVNGDGRADLVMRFSSVAAGLKCSTRTVLLKRDPAKGSTYEGTAKVSPIGC